MRRGIWELAPLLGKERWGVVVRDPGLDNGPVVADSLFQPRRM